MYFFQGTIIFTLVSIKIVTYFDIIQPFELHLNSYKLSLFLLTYLATAEISVTEFQELIFLKMINTLYILY